MVEIDFKTDGNLNKIMLAFSPSVQSDILMSVGRVVGVAAESVVSEYPTPKRAPLPLIYDRVSTAKKPYTAPDGSKRQAGTRYKSKFKSRAQQGKVFMLVKQGGIPYRRTGSLGRSITSYVALRNGDAVVTVGSNLAYAPLVIGRGTQAPYHVGHWPTLQDDIENNTDKIQRAAQRGYKQAIEERLP